MPAYLDLNTYQNENFDADISLSKYISNEQFDAQEYEVQGSVKKHYQSKLPSAIFTITPKSSGKTGVFNISLTPEQTGSMKYGKYVYDVFIKDKSRNVGRYSYKFPGNITEFLTIGQNGILKSNFELSDNFVFSTLIYSNNISYEIININEGLNISVENGELIIKNLSTEIFRVNALLSISTWVKIRLERKLIGTSEEYNVYYNDLLVKNYTNPDITYYSQTSTTNIGQIGKNLDGFLSNLILINGYIHSFAVPILNLGMEGVSLLTCRNYTFKDYSPNNLIMAPTTNVTADYFSPYKIDVVTYKVLEGALFVNPSSTPKF